MQRHAPRRIADVLDVVVPADDGDPSNSLRQVAARTSPSFAGPQGRAVPLEHSSHGSPLSLGELRQDRARLAHRLRDDALEIQHGCALRRKRRPGGIDVRQHGVDLREHRPWRAGGFRDLQGLLPGLLEIGQTIERRLKQAGPMREQAEPLVRLQELLLPHLLLRLDHVQRRLSLQDGRRRSDLEIDLLAELGDTLADEHHLRAQLRAGGEGLGDAPEEIRHLRSPRCHLCDWDRIRWRRRCTLRRRHGFRRLAGRGVNRRAEDRKQRPDDEGPGSDVGFSGRSGDWCHRT